MHYPHRLSKIKRRRKHGFLKRMSTSKGRKTINNKRRVGRRVNVK
jgi:ribosomal protein L34